MHSLKIFFWATTVVGICVFAARWHVIYGYSVDLSLHYALTNELFEHFGQTVSEEHLGVMFAYPAGAHWLAALLSVITHNPLVSINVLSLAAMYMAYVGMALFLIDKHFPITVLRLGLLLIATWLLARAQAAFGYQVILNFFFPQLLGEAIVVLSLYFLSREPFWNLRPLERAAVLICATWLLGYIQPLVAIQFGGSVVAYHFLTSSIVDGRIRFSARALLHALCLGVSIGVAIVVHPAFSKMAGIAAHNGYLRFGGWLASGNYSWIVAFSAAVAGLAVYGVTSRRLEPRPALLLAASSITAPALLILQNILLVTWGIGSEYAVSKHVFFLLSIAALTFAYSISQFAHPFVHGKPLRDVSSLVPCAFAVVAMSITFMGARTWRQELTPFLDYQAYAINFHRYWTPIDGERNVVSLNKTFTPILNHVISFGDLKLPYEIAMDSITASGLVLTTPVKYAIVSSSLLDSELGKRCSVGIPSPRYAVVERECFVHAMSVIHVGETLKTARNERGAEYLTDGWSHAEAWGTWSASKVARMAFSVDAPSGAGPLMLRLKYVAFIAGERRQQEFSVLVDERKAGSYAATDSHVRELRVPIMGNGPHVVEFRFDSPVSPQSLGLSADDDRLLSIGVLELQILDQ